jgi:hypothetical protein
MMHRIYEWASLVLLGTTALALLALWFIVIGVAVTTGLAFGVALALIPPHGGTQ